MSLDTELKQQNTGRVAIEHALRSSDDATALDAADLALEFGEIIAFQGNGADQQHGIVVSPKSFSRRFPTLVRTAMLEFPFHSSLAPDLASVDLPQLVGPYPVIITVGRESLHRWLGRLTPQQCAALRRLLNAHFIGLC